MASTLCPCATTPHPAAFSRRSASLGRRQQGPRCWRAFAVQATHNSRPPAENVTDQGCLQWNRRATLLALASLPVLTSQPAQAGDIGMTAYSDPAEGFTIDVPEGWTSGAGVAEGGSGFSGTTGARRALAWYVDGKVDTNITVIITNTGADFTALGSFGTAQTFGENLVASMDRSYLRRAAAWARRGQGPIQEAKLIDARENNKKYFVEYTVQKDEDEPKRHLMSVVALGFNGRYNRLYTVTAQCLESDLPQYKSALKTVVESFTPPAPVV